MNPVIFLIQDKNCGASFLLGDMIKWGLSHFNFSSEVKYIEDINNIKNSLVIVYKHSPTIQNIEILKSNNNKIIMDVVDEFIRPGTDVLDLYDYSYFDGLIIRVNKVISEYQFSKHLIIEYIPHHWDIRLQNVIPNPNFNPSPIGIINDARDMPFINELYQNNVVSFIHGFSHNQYEDLIQEFNKFNIHYSVRKTDSIAYKFKPFTKLITASAFEAPLITNYDWSLQYLLPSDYPYLTEGNSYEEIINLIQSIHPNTKEWNYAIEIMKHVKYETALINLVPNYINFFQKFL